MKGAGRFLGMDNGDLNAPTALSSQTKKANNGQVLVLLQAGQNSRQIELNITVVGLKPALPFMPVNP